MMNALRFTAWLTLRIIGWAGILIMAPGAGLLWLADRAIDKWELWRC